METVIVEREFRTAITAEDVKAMESETAWCFATYRVQRLCSYLSTDGKRMVCVMQGPDVESVRRANAKNGVPPKRIYRASVHTPE